MIKILYLIWILSLSFLAGAANVFMVLLYNVKASHHTGNLSDIAIAMVIKSEDILIITSLVILFFIGSFLSGVIFHQRKFGFNKRYGYVLILGGLIILISPYVNEYINLFFIPFLLGVQNGLFITYDGILIRSSHLTGYLTDSAFYIGVGLRGDKTKLKSALIYIVSIFIFVFGGAIMAYMWAKNLQANLVLSIFYIISGTYYFFLRKKKKETKGNPLV